MEVSRLKWFAGFMLMALLVGACGTADSDAVATAVAATVAAQSTQQAAFTPTVQPTTLTSTPTGVTRTPTATKLPPTLPARSTSNSCLVANLTSEAGPVDGEIMKPGTQFTKTWQITNNSTCSWDTSYRIVFWSGDLMGGATYYNFPQYAAPGSTVPVSLVLTAPSSDGTFKSEWMLQAPDGTSFGVGEYNVPFYTEINVSSSVEPQYGITSVEFETIREPQGGCPANVWYTVNVEITTNGPLEFYYNWRQQDGNDSAPKLQVAKKAGTITLSRAWSFHLAATPGQKWIAITLGYEIGNEYNEINYPKQYFTYSCG
jgi:hypothetical protein